jgi:hypothetical protein
MSEERSRFVGDGSEWDDTSICSYCVRKIRGTANCRAFPRGIPERFLSGDDHHLTPAEGDSGLMFEERPGEPAGAVQRVLDRTRKPEAGPQP